VVKAFSQFIGTERGGGRSMVHLFIRLCAVKTNEGK